MPRGAVNVARFKGKHSKHQGRHRRKRHEPPINYQPGPWVPLLDHDRQTTWGHPLSVRPSDLLPQLNASQRHVFKLIARGDVDALARYIRRYSSLDINCQDYQGYTPLVLAIKRNDEQMVHFLLKFKDLILRDALLHAIQQGNCTIVEMLLDVMRRSGSEMSLPGCVRSAVFSPDITPLILAAQCQHYQVIKLLLQRGHSINHPHPPGCFCEENCDWKHKGESLNDSKSRYHAYQAMASPPYICQSSTDPILTAFELSRELRYCSKFERELKNEYLQLSRDVAQFAVDLLHQCRTSEEVEQLLTRRADGGATLVDDPFPRVALAIDCKQKKFVAHPNAQHVLRQAWLGNCQHWRSLDTGGQLLRIVPYFLLLPFMALVYIVAPKSNFVQAWRAPIRKFISFSVSYIIFLAILYVHNQVDSYSYVRGPPDTGFEWLIIIYVTSFLWMLVRRCWKYGLWKFFRENWHWYDLIMLGLFYATFLAWGWAWYDVYVYGHRYVPRRFWYQYDPSLIAEALYAVATISAFGKLLFFFQIGNRLGPLQISMSRMFKDIADFLVVFLIVLVSFATGIHKLYHYYSGQVRQVEGDERIQSDAFVSFQATVKNLFWALFGYSPPSYADVVLAGQTYQYDNSTVVLLNKHKFTEAMGYLLYGIYNITAIVILLNLLIAMMSTSFLVVQENADEEWKFARTRLWLMFFEEGGTLPPPFNLIPTPKSGWYLLTWIYHKMSGQAGAACTLQNCCYYEEEQLPHYTNKDYEVLMGHLVQRYLRYSTQVHLRERHLANSDLQYLLHGVPDQHQTAPMLSTTSSSLEENEADEGEVDGSQAALRRSRSDSQTSMRATSVRTSTNRKAKHQKLRFSHSVTSEEESSA